MRILYYDWDSLCQFDFIEMLGKSGYEVTLTKQRCKDYVNDPEFIEYMKEVLRSKSYDYVYSFNYFPILSMVCEQEGIRYVSWIFDSPHMTAYHQSITNSCNYVFHFDKFEMLQLQRLGAKHCYHLPMGVNSKRLTQKLNSLSSYEADVSFVGRLYDKKNFYDQIRVLPEYLKGYLEGAMQAQKLIYGYNFLEEVLSQSTMNEILRYVNLNYGEDFSFPKQKVFADMFLGQKVTSLERIEILQAILNIADVHLYSDSMLEPTGKIHFHGGVNYEEEMPLVFNRSKINLNISLKSIQSGIPLRVFDILGAKGFCITNYQPELAEIFEIGKDLVVYDSIPDLLDKVSYYLEHEKEREEIAYNGYRKVCDTCDYELRISQMMNLVL